jgi:hypothetical protein
MRHPLPLFFMNRDQRWRTVRKKNTNIGAGGRIGELSSLLKKRNRGQLNKKRLNGSKKY